MKVEPADERDSSWEEHGARFRVFVFRGPDAATTSTDIVDASVEEALEAARALSRDDHELWALAAVVDDPARGRGLVWLSGMDYHDAPRNGAEWQRRRRMQDRYLSARRRRGAPVVLPGGRRLIRVFPEYSAGPLWESFTDAYVLGRDDLVLSDGLWDDLVAWNDEWQDRPHIEEPLPDAEAWRARGRALVERLRLELDGIAEVRPEFLD